MTLLRECGERMSNTGLVDRKLTLQSNCIFGQLTESYLIFSNCPQKE